MIPNSSELTWVEIDRNALVANARALKSRLQPGVIFCPALKANAYGHGLELVAKILQEESVADWICVNAIWEAEKLRLAGISLPIYVMGYIPLSDLEKIFTYDVRVVVYTIETVLALEEIGKKLGKKARIHLKVETGNNRQGINEEDITEWITLLRSCTHVELEGMATHFANIEDTSDHSYAQMQMEKFLHFQKVFAEAGFVIPYIHAANSAATLLFPKSHFTLVRAGISLYGLWPSEEVKHEAEKNNMQLSPVLNWRTKLAQVKKIKKGSFIGYGCTYEAKRDMILGIIPIGYYDGFDRRLSNKGEVIVRGVKVPICGRVCMNIIMADLTDVDGAQIEDVVTLIGRDGESVLSADEFAEKSGTIHYEAVTRIRESILRI